MSTAAALACLSSHVRPKPKSRLEILNIRDHFQGLNILSRYYAEQSEIQYGTPYLRWFTAGLGAMMAVGDLENVLDQLQAVGDTHAACDLGYSYGEPGQQWGTPQLVPNWNCPDYDVEAWIPLVDTVIDRGLTPIYVMPSEGQDGLAWTYHNFERIVERMRQGYDRVAYGVFQFGYDGTWPASWKVDQVKHFMPWARSVVGENPYLSMMFANGPSGSPYLYVEDESDYHKPWMQAWDCIQLSTQPDQVMCPSLVNYGQYMLGPALKAHGTCTPEWSGPWIMSPGTPRGPYVYCFREWAEYQWTHFDRSFTSESIQGDRARIESIGGIARG